MRSALYATSIYLSLYKYNEEQVIHDALPIHHGFELIYVHEITGELKAVVGSKVYTVNPGAFILIKPNQYHRIMVQKTQHYLRSMIKFDPRGIKEVFHGFPSIANQINKILNNNLEYQMIQVQNQAELTGLCQKWKQRVGNIPKYDLLEVKSLILLSFLSYLKPQLQDIISDLDTNVERTPVEVVMSWINRNYAQKITLNDLAEMTHLSPTYLSRMFRDEAGITITDYVTITRVRQACILLKETNLSVKEIGERIGIPNYSYFCSLFKKKLLISPLQYRKDSAGIFPGI